MTRWRRVRLRASGRDGIGGGRPSAIPSRGALVRIVPMVLFPMVLLLTVEAPLAAQDAPSLRQLEAEFNSAVLDYEAALSAEGAQRQLWEDRVIELEQVRASGGGTSDAAFRALERESRELQRLQLRVQSAEEAAEAARLALLAGLDRRREELEASYASSSDASERDGLEDLLRGVTRQTRRLENEPLASSDALQPLYSSITLDPRDQPPMLRFKIRLLERRIEDADSTVSEVERRIERLQGLQRIQQMGEDFLAGVGRFDDDLLRTGPPASSSGAAEEGMPTDSASAQEAVPLPQQIEEARLLREQLMGFRDELKRRVEQFEERLRRIAE